MKSIITFVLLLAFVGCSSGQSSHSKNLPKDIIGCWENGSVDYVVESNSSSFDSLALKELNQKLYNIKKKRKLKQEFKDPYIYIYKDYKETGKKEEIGKGNSSLTYTIKGDSLYIVFIDGYRKSKSTSHIYIINDTLYTELDIMDEVKRIYIDLKYDETLEFQFPKDFKITKAVRKGKFVRVKNCEY